MVQSTIFEAVMHKTCFVSDCDQLVGLKGAKGMCSKHYRRFLKHGNPHLVGSNKKHGRTLERVYISWKNMKHRCDNPNNINYAKYGGRGITYDSSWSDFENFYKDMGDRPQGMSLDRIDNNGNYSESNCRWADNVTQASNTRITNNRSLPVGIYYYESQNKYRAVFKEKTVGMFDDLDTAVEKRGIAVAEWRKLQGMETSYAGSSSVWREAVVSRLHEVLATKEYFTSDDILIPVEKRGIFTKTNSALGAILTAAKRSGLIEATSQFRESKRPSRHKAPLRVWKAI